MSKQAYVKIFSEIDIIVTPGLQSEDLTNYKSDVPDRLKVNPLWPKLTVRVSKGTHLYPSEIADWESVKSFVKSGQMSIGTYTDDATDNEVVEKKKEVKVNMTEMNEKLKKNKKLDEVASE